MSIRTRLFAATYDRFMKSTELGLAQHRATLLAAARGDVLEIGAGTGVNLGYYGDDVASLTLTEPDPAMLKRLQQRVDQSGRTATVLRAPAEDLPFDDERFDVVVSTLVLCGVDDQPRALREARRVVRPGGHLLFMEHVRSDDPRLAHKQDRLNWFNRLVVLCNCNRPTLETIRSAGFDPADVVHSELPKSPAFARPMVVGDALARAESLSASG
jgi:ubiquinone/menaquinone biosynthesis C-methylase UbiE